MFEKKFTTSRRHLGTYCLLVRDVLMLSTIGGYHLNIPKYGPNIFYISIDIGNVFGRLIFDDVINMAKTNL